MARGSYEGSWSTSWEGVGWGRAMVPGRGEEQPQELAGGWRGAGEDIPKAVWGGEVGQEE